MSNSRIPSPARSQGVISTPRKQIRRTQSVCSPARTNIRLSSIIDSYKVSPVPGRQSVLNDDTDIDMPRRLSWWKKIDDNSRDVLELLEKKELVGVNNVAEEFDVEVLSQENKKYALDLPESSDGESINSIVIPQRKLFTQKDDQPQIKFRQIKNNRETLQKNNKSYVDPDKELNIGRKTLFSQPSKARTKPVFPAALLDISANKTVNKTKEIPAAEVKGQVRSLFGGRPGTKRKNMFADFIASESEDEISDILPKVFGFQKRNEPKRRASSMSRYSPTSSIDLELEDWRLLPSSTMVENHIDEATSPVKRIKLTNLPETKDSEKSTNSDNTLNKTKHANKSVISKNKSKNLSNSHHENDKSNDINMTPRNASTNSSRVTRSMVKPVREKSVTASDISKNLNKTKNQTQNNQDRSHEFKTRKTIKNVSQKDSEEVRENQNMVIGHPDPDEDLTLEYDNDDNVVAPEIGTSLKNDNKNPKDKTASTLNVDIVEDKHNLVKQSSKPINEENVIKQGISINKICDNQEELLENKQNNIESSKVSNYFEIQNNSQEIRNVVGKHNNSSVLQKHNKSIDKNKSKSIRNSVEKCTERSNGNDMQKETSSKEQSVNKDVEDNEKFGKSSQNLNEDDRDDEEMETENELNDHDNYYEQSDKQEEANEPTNTEKNYSETEGEINEDEQQENESETENVSEERADNEEQEIINETNTDERDNEMILNDQRDNIEDKNQVTLPNVSHDTTGRHRIKNKSPEVILHDKTKGIDSFTVQARNTSVRKTKSIIFHNKLDTVTGSRRSTGFSDATGNSSAEGSGWDSHRTTRKTLRQTFGKDFTPRKSLRALVMEKTAKLQANNFTGIADNFKTPRANSTEYDQAQDVLDSYQETELLQVEQNIEMVTVKEKNEAIQIAKDVTERLEKKDKSEHLEGGNKTEQLEGGNKMDQSKSEKRDDTKIAEVSAETEQSKQGDATEQSEDRDETEQSVERGEMNLHQAENAKKDETEPLEEAMEQTESFERNETEHLEEREEVEEFEEREEVEDSEGQEMEEFEEGEEMEASEEREELEQTEEREEKDQSEQREEMEQSADREEMEASEEGEEMEESEEGEEIEESEEKEELEQTEEREEKDQSEQREQMEQSADREEMEASEEGQEMEESEEGEEMEESEEREELEQTEEREEKNQSEQREEMEQSAEREEMEESEEGQEMEESEEGEEMEESEEREELEQTEARGEKDQSEEREEMEESAERDETEPFEEMDDVGHSENDESAETEHFEERDEMEGSENEVEQFEERHDSVPEDEIMGSDHEVSKRTRQTSLETYLQKIQKDNAEKRRKMQEELRKSLKNPKRDTFNLFKVPQRPVQRIIKMQKPKVKQIKSVIPLEMLPSEVIEDMKYKPPKRFQPNNASWITKRLYKFLENKLEPKYDYKARIRGEKLVQSIYNFTKEVRRHDSVRSEAIEVLKREMARLEIVKTHFDFYEFCNEFFPREIRIKVVPDIVNNIKLPRHGVFSDILRES